VAQRQSDEEIARAKDDTAMKQAEDELKRAQLEVQRNEVVSRIDAEKNQEAVDEGQATLKQLKETYQLKRAAAAAAIKILEIQRDRAKEAMRYALTNAGQDDSAFADGGSGCLQHDLAWWTHGHGAAGRSGEAGGTVSAGGRSIADGSARGIESSGSSEDSSGPESGDASGCVSRDDASGGA